MILHFQFMPFIYKIIPYTVLSMAMQAFSYRPLDPSTNEIRLLLLNPLDKTGPGGVVSGRVIHSSILFSSSQLHEGNDKCSGYEALSYEWGLTPDIPSEQEPCRSGIILDGKLLDIRTNLYFALRQLRLAEKPRVLWVDALCIDQMNDRERNHQVCLMRNIYTQADRVLVWLGLNKPKAPNPLRRMRDFVDFYLNAPPPQDEAERIAFQSHSDSLDFKYLSVWNQFPILSYWSRLWIIQEFVLARDLLLCLDDVVIGLESFQMFCKGIEHLRQQQQWNCANFMETFVNGIPMHLYHQRMNLHDEKKAGRTLSLFDLMEKYGECKCMDLRDRAFGLHALSPQCCRDLTPVDYTVPSSEICANILHHYLLEHYGATQDAPDEIDCSRLLKKCRALCQTLHITLRDITQRPEIEDEIPSIEVTGRIIGTVCSSSTFGMLPGLYETPHFNLNPYYLRDIAPQDWDIRPLTLKICDQVWSLSSGKLYESEWLQWWGRVKVPQMLRKCMAIPLSSTLNYQPQFLKISNPARLVNMLQREEQQQEKNRDLLASETKADGAGLDRATPNECNLPALQSSLNDLTATHNGTCTSFFITNGIIGYTYGDIQEGDLVCMFRQSSVLVLIRCVGGTYEVAATGWMAFKRASDPKMESEDFWSRRLSENHNINVPVHFLFSAHGLMLLSVHKIEEAL